jgi:UDP-2,3-diacylglucosamine pyrophosphatase LpxH
MAKKDLKENLQKMQKPSRASLGKLAEMLDRQDIDISQIGDIKKVSVYQSLTKDAEGDPHIHDLVGIQISPSWETGPDWPVIVPGPKVAVPKNAAKKKKTAFKKCVVFPDMQIGYFRNGDGELEPTHDEGAIDIALSICKDVNPDKVALIGDNLDLPELGKYRLSPAFQQTTQASIDRATEICASVREAAPNAEIQWLAGNHEERLTNFMLDNAMAAFGIRQGKRPNTWPVLSVPNLCRLDDYNIEYLSGYPASTIWINEHIKVIHGDIVRSGGSTAHAYLKREKISVIYGHIHRREWAEMTRNDFDGPKIVTALSPGCLARIDGAVPSMKGGTDLDGRPLTRYEDWQQGLVVVDYEEGDGKFNLEMITIRDGWALYRDKEYQV